MKTQKNVELEKRDRELKAMNNERTRTVTHDKNVPLTKKQQQREDAIDKKKKAAKNRRRVQAKKRYNARVWRGWRENDGVDYPVVVIKQSETGIDK